MKFDKLSHFFADIDTIPPLLNQKFYPSLNGLRALSVLMVVHFHLTSRYHLPTYMHAFGGIGVNTFFVISGFLITSLCIKEKVATDNLSLKNFYIRRALRILPVAYLYIAVIALLNYFLHLDIATISFFSAALFTVNISYFQSISFDWNLAHFWTLSTEEQFYIFFPVLLKKRFSLYVAVVLFICIGAPIIVQLRPFVPFLNGGIISSLLRYVLKFQGIATGCLIAIIAFKGYLNFGKWNLAVTLISVFMIFYLDFDPASNLQNTFINLSVSTFTGLVVVNNIRYSDNIIYKILNLKILNIIGILSYSIYIWQQLILSNDPKFLLSHWPVNLLFVIVVPCLSYYFYEKYFLKLKDRFVKQRA